MRTHLLSMPLLHLVCALAVLGGSCAKDAPPPRERLGDEETAPRAAPKAKTAVSPLDSYGNLKGRGERVFGFERPHASREADRRSKVPVFYLMANEERMLRFFRSRGHVVVETGTGWRFEHSDRTLKALGDDAEAFVDAKIYARQGPGAGWTLIFDDGKPIETAKLPLLELLEQASAQAPTEASAEEVGSAGAQGAEAGGAPQATGSSGAAASGGSSAALRQLERAALERPIDRRRAKDVSARIYRHAKKKGGRFLD